MQCPPGRHSAPTPVDTTAGPGSFQTSLPGVVGVVRPLAPLGTHPHQHPRVSRLLCAICCHCRKRPRDKEAVDPGSARSTTTAHLVRNRHQGVPGPVPGWLSPRGKPKALGSGAGVALGGQG
ncbi:hypothetical protein MC885_009891 [Smutsia gigantea]|nr:hypothetical protein MC885_009891 [Smutsia gigantea]